MNPAFSAFADSPDLRDFTASSNSEKCNESNSQTVPLRLGEHIAWPEATSYKATK
jgi:hypothetical protein